MAENRNNEKEASLGSTQGRGVQDGEHRNDNHRPETSSKLEGDREAKKELAGEGELLMLPDVHRAYDGVDGGGI